MIHRILIICLVALMISCDVENSINSANENNEPDMANFNYINSKVLNQRCAISGCHLNSQLPILRSDVAYQNIVNKPGSTGQDYIEPGDPDNSYLYLKIIGGPGINGVQMPRNGPPLSQAITDSIRLWIENGAPNN